MNPVRFVSELEKYNINLSSKQQEQFRKYFHILVDWNEKMNLTNLTSESDVYLKHFFDSISLAFYLDMDKYESVCDVGAGAGFPSIPLKICFPYLKITIIDSLQKRIRFLEHLAKELQLEGTTFVHARAEDAGQNKKYREKFDLVTARAVARMSVLSELCLPLAKVKGTFAAMKGAKVEEELDAGIKAIETLGGKMNQLHSFNLPFENSERSIVIIDKVHKTKKKFPRKPGEPNRNPIE